ncbi:MAG TPA: hypothetical protein VD973_26650 [Symbiobacteriaceae bacterium]|nr:hypothetical protein [Symbiobacteriaceae bacterium]
MRWLIALLIFAVMITGCSGSGPGENQSKEAPVPAESSVPPNAGVTGPTPDTSGASSPAAPAPSPAANPVPPVQPPMAPADPRPDLLMYSDLSRAQLRDGLARLLEAPGKARENLDRLRSRVVPVNGMGRSDEIFWTEADLNGDGADEIIFTQDITDKESPFSFLRGQGAALCVIYQKDGRWAADVTDPFEERLERDQMRPHLHAVADLTGSGRPQIIWSRPHVIATGPQPHSVYVTAWTPGAFNHLPGEMFISYMSLKLEDGDLLLTGVSRGAWLIRQSSQRSDRYRFVDGAFRLVDRRFTEPGKFGYDVLWDGLVAEDVGRTADAEEAYRRAADPAFPAHAGEMWQYNSPPLVLTPPDMKAFATALRTFARFRLGALLLETGRREEAQQVLLPEGNPPRRPDRGDAHRCHPRRRMPGSRRLGRSKPGLPGRPQPGLRQRPLDRGDPLQPRRPGRGRLAVD